MKLSIEKALIKAKAYQNKNQIADAIMILEQVLSTFPKNKRVQKALSDLNNKIAAQDYKDQSHQDINRLVTLFNNGQRMAVYEEAIRLSKKYPNELVVFDILGTVAAQQGEFDTALVAMKKVISLNPNYADGYNNLGNLYYYLGNTEESISAYIKAVHIKPTFAEAYNNLSNLLKDIGKLDQATEASEKAISLAPNMPEAFTTLGVILNHKKMYKEAIEAHSKALSIHPNFVKALVNLSTVYQHQGEFEKAMLMCKKAISIKPDFSEAYVNMGTILSAQGKLSDAISAFDKAIDLCPNYAEALDSLGRLYWLNENFDKAFVLMEWRWQKKQKSIGLEFKSDTQTWDGSNNRKVFVWKEQGIGDEIMFSSIFSELVEKSAQVIVECDTRLLNLYQRSFPKSVKFIDDRNNIEPAEYDAQIAIASLPKFLRKDINDFADAAAGWLKPDLIKTQKLRQKVGPNAKDCVIGISWNTKANGPKSIHRSMSLEALVPYLKKIPGNYVNLQYGDASSDVLNISHSANFDIMTIDEIDLFQDIDGLAALISACDLVISIDNSTVHLAGALGVDTRVLLPKVADERWGLSKSDSYWYDNVTLYRQEIQGDWSGPLSRLVADLTQS